MQELLNLDLIRLINLVLFGRILTLAAPKLATVLDPLSGPSTNRDLAPHLYGLPTARIRPSQLKSLRFKKWQVQGRPVQDKLFGWYSSLHIGAGRGCGHGCGYTHALGIHRSINFDFSSVSHTFCLKYCLLFKREKCDILVFLLGANIRYCSLSKTIVFCDVFSCVMAVLWQQIFCKTCTFRPLHVCYCVFMGLQFRMSLVR